MSIVSLCRLLIDFLDYLNASRPHGFDQSRVIAFGLVAVGFGEAGQRGGKGVGLADVAGELGDVSRARVGSRQQCSANPASELARIAGEEFKLPTPTTR